MSNSIRLSEKHGVNPSVGVCFVCNQDSGELILAGRLPGDAEAPHRAAWHKQPCPKCADLMAQGVICISVRDGETGDNPYRTGGWCVVKDDAMRRVITDVAVRDAVLAQRVTFIPDAAWRAIGLPAEHLETIGEKTNG